MIIVKDIIELIVKIGIALGSLYIEHTYPTQLEYPSAQPP